MRPIDADNMAKFIDFGHLNNPDSKVFSENDVGEMIDMMPTIDAVIVVRCAYCKHLKIDTVFNQHWCDGRRVELWDYCSRGERRES